MTGTSRWLGMVVGVATVLGMAPATSRAVPASAAGVVRAHADRAQGASGKACKKRNAATGLIKYSDWQFPDTLNPVQTGLISTNWTTDGMFDSAGGPALWSYNNHAKLIPNMATTIPTIKNGGVKNGGRTIVVHLKPGLHWSNGKEITAADIKFGWHMGLDKLSGGACAGTCDFITSIDTPDKYTSVWHLKQPYAAAVPSAQPPIWPRVWANAWDNDPHVAAQKLWQDTAFNFENASFPTNGAYQVAQFINNDRIVLKPMKYYTGMNCGGYVKQLVFVFYSSSAGELAAATTGQTDVSQSYAVSDLPQLNKYKSKHFHIHVDPSFTNEHIELNVDPTYQGKPNPLANTKVRQALALAMDKIGLIQSALGVTRKTALSIAAWTPLVNTPAFKQPFADTKVIGQYDPLTGKYTVDTGRGKALADAKKLLAQTPYANGFNIDFYTTSGRPVRQAAIAVMQQNWARLGVKITPFYVTGGKLVGSWAEGGICDHGDFQIAMFALTGAPDPDYLKFDFESRFIDRLAAVKSVTNGNYSGAKDKILDRTLEQAARSYDKKVRTKAYDEMQIELNKMNYWIDLYFRPTIATDDGKIKSFSTNPTALGAEWNMFSWKQARG